MSNCRASLISLPWENYKSPSLAIGCLAAYAQSLGFDVDALNLHLEIAQCFSLDSYDDPCWIDTPAGEALGAALCFSENRKVLLKYANKFIPNANRHAIRLHDALVASYKNIDWRRYSIVGFSINFSQLFTSLLYATWIKRDHPSIRIVMGGYGVTGELGKSVLKCFPQVNWCIDGEGEISFSELLSGVASRSCKFEENVPGLIYRHGGIIKQNPRKQLPDLVGLPEPDYHNYFDTLNRSGPFNQIEILSYIPVEVSRGCTRRCAFCAYGSFMPGFRSRPPVKIANSVNLFYKEYGVSAFYLSTAMINQESTEELSNLLSSHNRDYRIFCEARAGLSKQQMASMKHAGICAIQIGLEALDTKLLSKMNKRTRLIDNLETMKFCEEVGIRHLSNLIVEFPTETQADIDRSIEAMDLASCYMPPDNIARFGLFPGSPIYRNPKKFKIRSINEAPDLGKYLPNRLSSLKLYYSDFECLNRKRNYRRFFMRHKRWRKEYERAQAAGRSILQYFDCGDSLRVEDFREGIQATTLCDLARELYLFCDEIRNFAKIRKKFKDVPEREIRKMLRKLFKLKVMYTEDDDWLSLAIHISPKNRRHMMSL